MKHKSIPESRRGRPVFALPPRGGEDWAPPLGREKINIFDARADIPGNRFDQPRLFP